MGEVYRARDTRLEREVAVKVLPKHLSSSEEMRQRFEREAKAISQLSHPHICALYDVGSHEGTEYLVMELLEGETLSARLAKGALPLEQTLRFGIEIAEALDKAHRQGIVHRDLKPGNVMLTKSGVKLLDFGLAKVMAPAEAKSGLTSLPTMAGAPNLTQQGSILGTFQYMAPEQLEGGEADARSDIFAFGAVLYEMATGRKAFSGKSQASLISSIMKEEPAPISAVAPLTPLSLERVIRTCLAKDPEDRWQSAHDIGRELKWIAEGSQAGMPAPVVSRRRRREAIAWSAAGVLALALAAFALLGRRPDVHAPVVRLSLEMPVQAPWASFDHAAVSPDGRLIAFIAHTQSGKRSIWIRPLQSLSANPLPGTDDALQLFWAPNSASIGFFAEGKLKRIEASGGPPQVLADAPNPAGGTWNGDGVILFSPKQYEVIHRIAATGGAVTAATKLGPNEDNHIWPCFLPDGRHFVFLGDASATVNHSIRLGSLDSQESVQLVSPAVTSLAFAVPDWLLFVRAGALVAQRLDAKARKLVGEPALLGERIASIDIIHGFEFSVSQTGVLLYRTANPESQLAWFDRSGKRQGDVGEPVRYGRIELSPDERRIVFERVDADGRLGNLWLQDLTHGSTSRLTATAGSDYSPIWSPDGSKILFGSARPGLADLFEVAAGGGSVERQIFHDAQDKNTLDWARDGRFVLFLSISPATREDIWILPLSGEGKAAPLVATRFSELDAQVSPDGKWFAYSSDESGRTEIYVQSFADPSKRSQVSSSGGARPRWRGDGKEIFFLSGNTLQSVSINAASNLESGKPKDLFRLPLWEDYAITRDGQRILAATSVEDNPVFPPTVVLNWTADLKRP
jgi:WD40 repeat protein